MCVCASVCLLITTLRVVCHSCFSQLCMIFLSIQSKKSGQIRRQLLLDTKVEPSEYGTVVEMASFTAGRRDVICFATTRGKLCGLDLRSNRIVWELTNEAKYGRNMYYNVYCIHVHDHVPKVNSVPYTPHVHVGLSISMAVDPLENWIAVGTSLGYHVIWDMRFQLPIRKWQHTGHGGKRTHLTSVLNYGYGGLFSYEALRVFLCWYQA